MRDGAELAHLLLRVGSLDPRDQDHQRVYAELMGDAPLFEEVRRRLDDVGYELVQDSGHLGVRVARWAELAAPLRNLERLHAGHVRLLVYLWVHLVYREWMQLRRDLAHLAPDKQQLAFDEIAPDEVPVIAYSRVFDDFRETTADTNIKGWLRKLQRERFIRIDKRSDRIEADASLYVLVDRSRMEDFVVDLARRMGGVDPMEAVEGVAGGSRVGDTDDGGTSR